MWPRVANLFSAGREEKMEKKTCKRLRCRYLRRPARKIELLDVFSNAPRNLKRLSRQLFRPCCSMRPPFLPLRVSFSSTFAFLAHAPHPLCSFFFSRLSSKNRATPVLSSEPPDGKSRSPADRSRNNQFYNDRFRSSRRYPR